MSNAKENLRRYRAKVKRIDYAPSPDVLRIIMGVIAGQPKWSYQQAIDEMIRRGMKSISRARSADG